LSCVDVLLQTVFCVKIHEITFRSIKEGYAVWVSCISSVSSSFDIAASVINTVS
jgi:hypothetical protein